MVLRSAAQKLASETTHSPRLAAAALSAALAPVRAIGVDLSTRHTGIAVVCSRGGLLHEELLSAHRDEHTFSYGQRVSARVAALHRAHAVTTIGIEDFVKSYTFGSFRTQDLFKLARLNGIVGYGSWTLTDRSHVDFYMPTVIRSYFGCAPARAPRNAALAAAPDTPKPSRRAETKQAVWDYVAATFPAFAVTLQTTKTGSPRETNYDRSDAILVAMYAVAAHVEREVLRTDDGALFYEFAEGVLTSARKSTKAPPPSIVEVQRCHSTWLAGQRLSRSEPQNSEMLEGASSEAAASAHVRVRSAGRKRTEPLEKATEATYLKLRTRFSEHLKTLLCGRGSDCEVDHQRTVSHSVLLWKVAAPGG